MRVVLAEDQYLLRDGLTRMLEAHGMDVRAAVETGPELLRALVDERPDVAVVDVRLPPAFKDEGLQAALEARRRYPDCRCSSSPSTSSSCTRASCSPTARGPSAIC